MTNLTNELRNMWSDAYKFHDSHVSLGDTEQDWLKVATDARDLCMKHNNHPFILELMVAVIADLDRVKIDERKRRS